MYGAVAGPLISAARFLMFGETLSSDPGRLIGQVLGMVVGGAFLFTVVAAIRNLFVRA
jgi:hypothetical protein